MQLVGSKRQKKLAALNFSSSSNSFADYPYTAHEWDGTPAPAMLDSLHC